VDTSTGFVVACLMLFGFGMGLMLTPVSNMIMNSVARNYQGMVSGLIIVERFAPMSMGIALFNLVFMQGIITVATHNEITRTAPVNIQIETLMAGFDLAFIFAFLVGVIILVLAIVARQETHPDYQKGADEPLTPPTL
ncbi:MAG: MFS transporter, partial [Methanomicrobiales archaeon]